MEGDSMSVDWEMVVRANSGDEESLSQVSKELSGPNRGELLKHAGDLGYQVEMAILTSSFANQEACQMAIQEQLLEIRRDLGFESASGVERLMIQRVCLCWLAVHTAELQQIQQTNPIHELRLQERVDRAQRRYLQALKALASVRRLVVKLSIQG
jgi:hypothetical protein